MPPPYQSASRRCSTCCDGAYTSWSPLLGHKRGTGRQSGPSGPRLTREACRKSGPPWVLSSRPCPRPGLEATPARHESNVKGTRAPAWARTALPPRLGRQHRSQLFGTGAPPPHHSAASQTKAGAARSRAGGDTLAASQRPPRSGHYRCRHLEARKPCLLSEVGGIAEREREQHVAGRDSWRRGLGGCAPL